MEPSNENSKGRKINILSLDGGGIRGLSSLIILKHLSFRCKKPLHEIFDLICGTSTGGIIAIMLGVLKMDIDECIKLYMEMGAQVFEKIPRVDPTVESWEDLFVPKERYSDLVWESVIKATLQKKINPEKFMKEKGEEPMPKVFVVAQRKEGKRHLPYCFRNYDVFPDDTAGTSKIKIWQAARATSAVPFYFSAVEIDGFHYIDGSIGDNNPTILAYDVEAFNAFPGCEVNAIISVGTGLPSFQVDNGSVEDLISRVLLVSLDTEVSFNRFEISLRNHGKTDMLYRFNVEDIGDIVWNDTQKVRDMVVATEDYLQKAPVHEKMEAATNKLLVLDCK